MIIKGKMNIKLLVFLFVKKDLKHNNIVSKKDKVWKKMKLFMVKKIYKEKIRTFIFRLWA